MVTLVVCVSRHSDGAVTVVDPDGARLKLPMWMVSPAAARFCTCDQATIAASALLAVGVPTPPRVVDAGDLALVPEEVFTSGSTLVKVSSSTIGSWLVTKPLSLAAAEP